MWDFGRRNRLIDVLIIILIFAVIMGVFREWGFPWWLFFFVWPVFTGWKRDGQHQKQKREPRVYLDDEGYEKPKREPRYALGDDGELIELPTEDDDTIVVPKRQRDDYV